MIFIAISNIKYNPTNNSFIKNANPRITEKWNSHAHISSLRWFQYAEHKIVPNRTYVTATLNLPLLESHRAAISIISIWVMWQVLFKNIISCQDNVSINKLTNIHKRSPKEGSILNTFINTDLQWSRICMTADIFRRKGSERKRRKWQGGQKGKS